MFYELSLAVFTGSANNPKFHNKKLVLWDNEKKSVICSTQFKSEILNIKIIRKLIFVTTRDEINVCIFNEKYSVIEITNKLTLDGSNSTSCFEAWVCEDDKKYYLANISNKTFVNITVIYETCLEATKIKTIDTGLTSEGIQNIIYNEKVNILFVIDVNGSNIKGFNCSDFQLKCEFYRGKNFAMISSITSIKNKYIAVASGNKTIHIFEINQNEAISNSNVSTAKSAKNSTNIGTLSFFSGYLYKFLTNPYQLNKSIIKIRLNEINENYEFFDLDFKKKGTILFYDDFNDELSCLGYNGKIYILKLDFKQMTYEIKSKFNWCIGDDIKNSQYTSEDFSLDLNGLNKKKEDDSQSDNWKII